MSDPKKDGELEHLMGLDEVVAQLPEGHLARMELAALRSAMAAYTKLINEEGFPPEDMGDDNAATGAAGGMKSFIESLLPGMEQKVRRHELVQIVSHVLPILLGTGEDEPWPAADGVADDAVKYAKAALARIDEEARG